MYFGAQFSGISKPKALHISTCGPTKGVMNFILPLCSLGKNVFDTSELLLQILVVLADGTGVGGQDESDEAYEHLAVLGCLRPCAQSVLSEMALLQAEALLLLIPHAIVVLGLQRREVRQRGEGC